MTIWLWVGFTVFVLALLALDLGVFQRKEHVIRVKEALAWTVFWVALALVFNVAIYFMYRHHWLGLGLGTDHATSGGAAAMEFFTGYIIEKTLSLDNIFVIAMIFDYFAVPRLYQHRVLFLGILGALVMRMVMILAGVALIRRFEWIIYVFGALLIGTAVKMLLFGERSPEPDRNPIVRVARKLFPVTGEFEGHQFFTRREGRLMATPMLLVLLMIESSDVLFAVDSIPAIFAVTRDPFIVFTSNVFAILGLRSLFFALAGMLEQFRYLKVSIVFILGYVGVKMLLSHHLPIPTPVSLGVIAAIIGVGILASIAQARRDRGQSIVSSRDIGAVGNYVVKRAWRVLVLIIGCSVLLIGLVLLVLPGPAFIVIPLGLAILATEFVWARRVLQRVRQHGMSVAEALRPRWTRNLRRPDTSDDEAEPAPDHP